DIRDRQDIERLVVTFYERAFEDVVLGHIFVDVAKMDLVEHLPHMCDFWETVLFKTATYGRNAFEVHQRIHAMEQLTPMHFQRWEDLWHKTLDQTFRGEKANLAKLHASRMSGSIQRRLASGHPANVIRIV
ncbi:MAG: group III truncated hemoglobin, partial [Thermomicrobiales bacterium]